MQKIIIIAGNGLLPINIINSFISQKFDFFTLIISESGWDKKIQNYDHKFVKLGSILTELIKLKKKGFDKVVLAGSLKRPSLSNIKPDLNTIKIIPKFTKILFKGGDNSLLKFVIEELEKNGIEVLNIKRIVPQLFLGEGFFSKKKFNQTIDVDIKKGKEILNVLSKHDVGQSIIIQQGDVIGIEALEGTDELIRRCSRLFKDGTKPTLIKLIKKNQEIKADLPTIGPKTIHLCKKFSLGGIAYSAGNTLFIDSLAVIKDIDKNKMFLYGMK